MNFDAVPCQSQTAQPTAAFAWDGVAASAQPVFALVDVNNFYVSCERVFAPHLQNVPVLVLSNNDGCVISRSAEVKALGISMAQPWHEVKALAQQQGVVAFSSNYTLYGDMSARVVSVLSQYTPELEVYSIDESFLRVESVAQLNGGHIAMGLHIKARLQQWLGLPVCVGFGRSKTEAKLANHWAKTHAQWGGVLDLGSMDEATRLAWMQQTAVGKVWGIGRKLGEKLQIQGIQTVADLMHAPPAAMRAQFGVVMERTVRELNGESCLALDDITQPRQQIISSRSFANTTQRFQDVRESVAFHTEIATVKLRKQGSAAGMVVVFLQTSRFRKDKPAHNPSIAVPLPYPSANTFDLMQHAVMGLKRIYRTGIDYKKAGVMLLDITRSDQPQQDLFMDKALSHKQNRAMAAIDAINDKWGKGTLRNAATGTQQRWAMRSEARSPRYTTHWAELPVVNAQASTLLSMGFN